MRAGDRARRELAAMQAVADALSQLTTDPAACDRVLGWAAELFGSKARAAAGPAAVLRLADTARPVGQVAHDPENLASLFDGNAALQPAAPDLRERATPGAEPLGPMVESFVADFKELARDWHVA
jgi:hypothetical protein